MENICFDEATQEDKNTHYTFPNFYLPCYRTSPTMTSEIEAWFLCLFLPLEYHRNDNDAENMKHFFKVYGLRYHDFFTSAILSRLSYKTTPEYMVRETHAFGIQNINVQVSENDEFLNEDIFLSPVTVLETDTGSRKRFVPVDANNFKKLLHDINDIYMNQPQKTNEDSNMTIDDDINNLFRMIYERFSDLKRNYKENDFFEWIAGEFLEKLKETPSEMEEKQPFTSWMQLFMLIRQYHISLCFIDESFQDLVDDLMVYGCLKYDKDHHPYIYIDGKNNLDEISTFKKFNVTIYNTDDSDNIKKRFDDAASEMAQRNKIPLLNGIHR